MFDDFFRAEHIEFYRELDISDLVIQNERKYQNMIQHMGTAESALIFLIPYNCGQQTTNLSVYAQVRDYHDYLRELTERFRDFLIEIGWEGKVCGFTDSSPISERRAALEAGLGVAGENGLVLNEKYGSYFFIGEFFLSRRQAPQPKQEVKKCVGCHACRKACPTGAIDDPKRERCLSLLSQKKHLTDDEQALVDQAECKWGCDLCQSVCPMNRTASLTPIPYFQTDLVTCLTEDAICAPEEEFSRRAYAWRGREVLRRNLKKK